MKYRDAKRFGKNDIIVERKTSKILRILSCSELKQEYNPYSKRLKKYIIFECTESMSALDDKVTSCITHKHACKP